MREISFRNDILPLKDKLYRLALRITLNSAEAEDVVQDTMIRVWNKRDEWPQFESIEAYCLTIARNLAIDRSQKMEAQNLQLTSEVREMPDTLTPYDRLAQNEQIQLVHRLVNELPERQRTTMQLRDVEGKSYKEIADILQITEEQVKVTLFRARQKIKQRYTEIEDMDYKYIEQLLERYWNCETSLEEEQILRSFFRQKEVPAHLLRYKQLFAYQDVEKEKGLGDDFDTRILTRIERPVVKAQRLTMRTRFMPLFKAAAMIAVLFLMGTVMQHAMEGGDSDTVSVHDEYQNSTTDPQVAYEPVLPTDTVTKITADDTGTGTGKTN